MDECQRGRALKGFLVIKRKKKKKKLLVKETDGSYGVVSLVVGIGCA
jgi:hypothetical protein